MGKTHLGFVPVTRSFKKEPALTKVLVQAHVKPPHDARTPQIAIETPSSSQHEPGSAEASTKNLFFSAVAVGLPGRP